MSRLTNGTANSAIARKGQVDLKYPIKVVALLILSCIAASLCGAKEAEFIPLSKRDLGKITAYEVNKRVKDFPEKEDLSKPESAYAAIQRVWASGEEGGWRRVSCKASQDNLPPANAPRKTVDPRMVEMLLNAKILEVQVWRSSYAQVCAERVRDGRTEIDTRVLQLEGGKWLSRRNDMSTDLAVARDSFQRWCRTELFRTEMLPPRTRIADPEAYLKPYVDFLRKNAKEPREFVLDALKSHEIVILGELHARQVQWQFAQSVVAHPDFARHVGAIYLEMPVDHQALVDKYIASQRCDPEPIIEVFRSFWEEGWPMQSWLDFFTTVWTVNQTLPQGQRIRIVFTDCRRPWKDIEKKSDWDKYEKESDRDPLMARTILNDRREHAGDKRNGLFIVGYSHAGLNFETMSGDPIKTAAWYLREALGGGVYSILPHTPGENGNEIRGRRCLGLFDSAFAEAGNTPMAFTLAEGPFGEQHFDGRARRADVSSRYCDGYSAYLYFGPLEYEISPPMIPGFHTAEFITEMDRRLKLMRGKGWAEIYGKELTVENVVKQYSYWGKPQSWVRQLGPVDAWHYGGPETLREEKLKEARAHPEVIIGVARGLFDAMRGVDYSQGWDGDSSSYPPGECDYGVQRDYPAWISWCYRTFKDNPIASVEIGKTVSWKVSKWGGAARELPTVEYKLTLKDGTLLTGELPIDYDGQQFRWHTFQGMDWHLRK